MIFHHIHILHLSSWDFDNFNQYLKNWSKMINPWCKNWLKFDQKLIENHDRFSMKNHEFSIFWYWHFSKNNSIWLHRWYRERLNPNPSCRERVFPPTKETRVKQTRVQKFNKRSLSVVISDFILFFITKSSKSISHNSQWDCKSLLPGSYRSEILCTPLS